MKKWNHYVCPKCGSVTVARHDDEGVTPFLLRCRAKDQITFNGLRIPGCDGMAESKFFDDSCQKEDQTPHVIFFRPEAMAAIEFINKQPKRDRAWLLEHYQKGGALMKENP